MKKKLWIPVLGLTAMLTLGGCAQQQSQLGYIGEERAQSLALAASGIPNGTDAVFTASTLDSRNGTEYYRLDFIADGVAYQCDVDAVTGTVIELRELSGTDGDDDGTAAAPPAQQTTQTQNGNSSTPAQQAPQSSGNSAGNVIGEAAAKEKALAHAGLRSSDVTFVKAHLDRDDGRYVYDVEFYTSDYKEYDYEIDAATGEVLSYDYDAEYYTPPASGTSQNAISEAKAKEIALGQVPGATVSDIWEFEIDYDDGRLEYEGTIVYNHMEYEFTIDGYSGAIREWEADSVYD